jgi:succinoglycan biosynthesis transport protein ExoP
LESLRYVRATLRSWWIVLLALLAGGGGGFYVYHSATPLYRTSVRIVIASITPGIDPASGKAQAALRAQSLAQVASTNPAIKSALAAAGFPNDAPGVNGSADGVNPYATITVTDTSAVRGAKIANAFVDTVSKSADDLLGTSSAPYKVTSLAAAQPAGAPYTPIKSRDLGFGIGAGLLLGIALALLREALSRAIRDTAELRKVVDLTLLGTVPSDMPNKPLPSMSDPRSSRAEAYRQIRTSLLNIGDVPPQVVGFTSAVLGEGKTSVAANVAVAFARAGHRVALVDADLRRPKIADVFGIKRSVGLAHVLDGTVELRQTVTMFENNYLCVIPAGKVAGSPSEAVSSQAMVDVVTELAANFDFVFLDTPPVLPVTDALAMSHLMQGIVLVVRLGSASPLRTKQAMDGLERVHAPVVGMVANRAGATSDATYSYPYMSSRRPGRSHTKTAPPEPFQG